MNKSNIILLLITVSFLTFDINAQNSDSTDVKIIKSKNELWNNAFNKRDTISLYTLYAPESMMISAGGKWVSKTEIKGLIRYLFYSRPDITWNNEVEKIEVNEQWPVAYETGIWTESWTEKNDSDKSAIVGKYWIMYRKKDRDWIVHSSIYTPISCKGSYCEK